MDVGPWGLELERAQYILFPGSINQQQACAQGTLLAPGGRCGAEMCIGFIPLNI